MGGQQERKAAWEIALQRQAFDLKRTSGKSLGQCYEDLAKQQGYRTYAALRAACKGQP